MQTEQLILTAINTVRQAFGHGRFIDPTDLSTPAAVAAIQKYLATAPSINDDTVAIDVYQGAELPLVVFSYNHDGQIIAGETWTWIMLDEALVANGTAFRLMSTDTVERLNMSLGQSIVHYAK
ncbi:hypothetical protein [Weissella cibaria]|uniref:hypothetical protein n=1 Tax=Weissella cibaria TaxID=137591 RepID=UPI0012383E9E|nr:hypothetical protein [Weissella cibaria]